MSPSRKKNQNQIITPKDLYNKGKPIDSYHSPISKYIENKTGQKYS